MKTFYKSQHKIVFMVVLALLLQIVAPMAANFAYADEVEKAFTFKIVEENGRNYFKWTFNPKLANGEREFRGRA